MEWRHSRSPRPKKFRLQKSAGNVLVSIFWAQDGILLFDYLPKGQTINAEYYSSPLVQLKDILKEKSREAGRSPRGSCSCKTMPRLPGRLQSRRKWPTWASNLDHPPYSPDLAPSDYHLFHGLKKQMKGRLISSDAEIIVAAEIWLDGQLLNLFECLAKVRAMG